MHSLLKDIAACQVCKGSLADGVRPVVQASATAELIIIGQAPGRKVHETGIPWNDRSGDRLRQWLELDDEIFYDSSKIALVPMGLCFPGTSKAGDLPPRPECAPLWHNRIFSKMPNAKLILLVGQYAQRYYLQEKKKTLTDTVRDFHDYLPTYLPLPHPSPRNQLWLKRNPWFEDRVLPELRAQVQDLLR